MIVNRLSNKTNKHRLSWSPLIISNIILFVTYRLCDTVEMLHFNPQNGRTKLNNLIMLLLCLVLIIG